MKSMKLSSVAFAAMLVAVACTPGAGTPTTGPTTGGGDPTGTAPSGSPDMSPDTAPSGSPDMSPDMSPDGPPSGEFGTVEVASGQPIKLGTALVITTADADLGTDSQYGAQVAAEIKGQVLGHDIEFVFQDDQCSTEGGTTAAQALVSDPQIVAVIGTSCSSAGIPAAQITSDAGILMVSPSNTAPSLTAPETHEEFYARTAHNDTVQGAAMATYACEELGAETAATVHDGSAYAEQLQQVFADEFVAQCDGRITRQEAVAPTDTDMRTVLTTIAADPPDLLYYPIFTAGGALMTQQARQTSGLEDTDLAGADGMQSPTFLEAAGDAALGVYASGPDLAFAGDFYSDEFLPAYEELSGSASPLSVFHAHAFDAANMIFQAIEDSATENADGSLTIDRVALRDAFFAIEGFEGITGNLSCNETGDCADPKISVAVVAVVADAGDDCGASTGEVCFQRIWPED